MGRPAGCLAAPAMAPLLRCRALQAAAAAARVFQAQTQSPGWVPEPCRAAQREPGTTGIAAGGVRRRRRQRRRQRRGWEGRRSGAVHVQTAGTLPRCRVGRQGRRRARQGVACPPHLERGAGTRFRDNSGAVHRSFHQHAHHMQAQAGDVIAAAAVRRPSRRSLLACSAGHGMRCPAGRCPTHDMKDAPSTAQCGRLTVFSAAPDARAGGVGRSTLSCPLTLGRCCLIRCDLQTAKGLQTSPGTPAMPLAERKSSRLYAAQLLPELSQPSGAAVQAAPAQRQAALPRPAFCVGGTAPQGAATNPGLKVDGVGLLGFPLPPEQDAAIKAQARRAPFGRGTQTVLDPAVRQTWQLEPTQFALTNPGETCGAVQLVQGRCRATQLSLQQPAPVLPVPAGLQAGGAWWKEPSLPLRGRWGWRERGPSQPTCTSCCCVSELLGRGRGAGACLPAEPTTLCSICTPCDPPGQASGQRGRPRSGFTSQVPAAQLCCRRAGRLLFLAPRQREGRGNVWFAGPAAAQPVRGEACACSLGALPLPCLACLACHPPSPPCGALRRTPPRWETGGCGGARSLPPLPPQGGELVVRHAGKEHCVDVAAQNTFETCFVAFYAGKLACLATCLLPLSGCACSPASAAGRRPDARAPTCRRPLRSHSSLQLQTASTRSGPCVRATAWLWCII